MTIDLDVLLLAAAGAGLLVAGGALLRPGGGDKEREAALTAAADDAQAMAEALAKEKRQLEADLAKAKDESQKLKTGVERAGYEASAEREQIEARVVEATKESSRLSDELKAEQMLVQQMEASLDEVRGLLRAAQEELRTSKETQAAGPPRPTAPKAQTQPPRSLEATEEIDQLKKSLATMTEERDAARNKAEAMERLVEGVRARSRELTKELADLRKQHEP